MKKLLLLGLSITLVACQNNDIASDTPAQSSTEVKADKVYYGGDILTMEGDLPSYTQALATKDGKIIYLGDLNGAKVLSNNKTAMIDLKGQALLPGFIDAHGHVTQLALALNIANLAAKPYGEADNFAGLQSALRHYIKKNKIPKGQWVLGLGYDTSILPNHPDKALLDEVSTDHPILIIHSSGHIGVVNSLALKQANINKNTENPSGGLIQKMANGEPNGVLEESAMWPVMLKVPKASHEQELQMLQDALASYASYGITTVQDGRTSPKDLALLESAAKNDQLYLDVISYPAIEMLNNKWQPDFEKYKHYQNNLRIGGVKLSLDGSMPGKTAYTTKPYHVIPEGLPLDYHGYTAFDDAQVNAFVKKAWDNNWQIIIHTNADGAGDQMIKAIQEIGEPELHTRDWRPVMIHAQMAREDQFDQMKKLDILVSFEMTHPFLFGDYYLDSVMGKELGARNNPAGSAVKRDINFTFHNDSPVVVPDLLMTTWAGVNRLTRSGKVIGPEQRVSAYQALKSITINAAYQNFEEDSKGSLAVGKQADFVILKQNPVKVEPQKIKDIKVIKTINDDDVVWPRNS